MLGRIRRATVVVLRLLMLLLAATGEQTRSQRANEFPSRVAAAVMRTVLTPSREASQ